MSIPLPLFSSVIFSPPVASPLLTSSPLPPSLLLSSISLVVAALGAALVAIVAYKYAHDRNARGGWRIGTIIHTYQVFLLVLLFDYLQQWLGKSDVVEINVVMLLLKFLYLCNLFTIF